MRIFRDMSRHIRNGFRNLFRNGWMTTATILTMTLTLFMIGALIMFMNNVDNVVKDIEQGVKVRVHIDIAANKEDEEQLKSEIEQIEHVTDITYRTKDEELQDAIEQYGEEFELFQDDQNPMYNVYVVAVDDTKHLSQVQEEIDKLKYTAEVTYGSIDTENLLRVIEITRITLALVAALLVVVALALVSNTIKMTINARQAEIQIMRLEGAKNSYIRSPFQYECMFIVLLSAILASVALYFAYEGLQIASLELVGVKIIIFTPTIPFILYISLALIFIGMFLGRMGASKSIKQYLKL